MWGLQELRMLNRRTLSFFEDIDVYLCPVMAAPPPPLGYLDPVAVRSRELNQRQGRLFPYTAAVQLHRASRRSRCRWLGRRAACRSA